MAKPHFLVVMGYGCHLDTPLGQTYLPRVVRFINEQRPDCVILCGGQTQHKTAPEVSEAQVMFSYLYNYLEDNPYRAPEFLMEEDSYTTFENIRNAVAKILEMVRYWKVREKARITIFCEATRAPSVVWLARHFMGDLVDSIDDITVETASWERADPFKQVWKMIYNKLAIWFPFLARRERKKRIRRAEQI